MQRVIIPIAFLLVTACTYLAQGQVSPYIHVDQFGYLSSAEKVAVLSNPQTGYNASLSYSPGATIELRNFLTDAVVFSGAPVVWNGGSTHMQSGDRGWWFDFSAVTSEGTYYLVDPANNEKTGAFKINANPYQEVLNSTLRMFYYNRCNHTKETPYAESNWTDGMNFINPLQDANCRFVNDRENISLEKDLTGGWFDAGDYNKYVTFAHSAVHNLLSAYEENPDIFTDDWNWPESGNAVPDILDEIKWELDWLMKMTNPDGTVHIKMGSIEHSHNAAAPPSANNDRRYYGPLCSAASVAIASMFSHAAKVFTSQPGMQSFAQNLEGRAIACWNHFKTKFDGNNLDFACDDGTIKAGDADWSEDDQKSAGIVAATYLFELTANTTYNNFIITHYDEVEPISNNFWGPYRLEIIEALLLYRTLSGADATVSAAILTSASNDVNNNWNGFFALGTDDLYRANAPDWMYHWGSNNPKANTGNLCQVMKKYGVLPIADNDLEEKTAELLHYFHGVNPMGMLHLSNMYAQGGDRCVNEIYHTWFNDGTDWDHAINSTYGPAPGFLTGGPNKDFSVSSISPPSGQPPQKSYLDFNTGWPDNSWEISEPAIYYQAAYLRLLSKYVSHNSISTNTENLKAANSCIEIFPNPTSNYFHLKGVLDRYHVQIYDLNGQLHQSVPYVGSEAVINMGNLPAGTYFLRVENKQNSDLCVQKILKE